LPQESMTDWNWPVSKYMYEVVGVELGLLSHRETVVALPRSAGGETSPVVAPEGVTEPASYAYVV